MKRIELEQECGTFYELGYQGFSESPVFVYCPSKMFELLSDFLHCEFDDKSTIHLFVLHLDESGNFSYITVFYTRKGNNCFAFFEINDLEDEYIKECLNKVNNSEQ